jgi:Baseplate wedge protein gp25
MAELSAQERLQPSLLDRLIDDDPASTHEADDKRTLTKQALRQAVLRDLGWLLNATGYCPAWDEKRFPNASRSVLNFGLPTMSGQYASSMQRASMEQSLRQAILNFELLGGGALPYTGAVEIIELHFRTVTIESAPQQKTGDRGAVRMFEDTLSEGS